jgi:hypothetical protein
VYSQKTHPVDKTIAVLKNIVDFNTLLIGAEGTKLWEYGSGKTPQALAPRRLAETPTNRLCLERKSTDKFNRAKTIKAIIPLAFLLLKNHTPRKWQTKKCVVL